MPQDKPNILVIWGDDIGITNLSCYSDGLMGYRTPNIDRIANEGMRFTDSYGEQSCTAGRSSFITGQSVFRTGLSKVGLPGAPVGLQAEDPTIAELLKNHGYATGQFGKNHLGDRNEFLPTVHGFDEFFGNLYHLNAEEDPEDPDYPSKHGFEEFHERFGPRGVLQCRATNKDDPKEHPRWGRVGKQRIKDTGPLTRKRMETCDDEFVAAAADFIQRQHNRRRPFFCWVNTTHMHLRTHTKRRSLGKAGRWQSPYHDTMLDHDGNVGQLLDLLDKLGIADDTIVDVRHRQRAAHEHVARRGDDALPQREEHELGRRLPRPADGALARQDPGGRRLQRDRPAPRLAAHVPRGRRRARHRREAEEGPRGGGQDVQGAHRRVQPAAVPHRRGGEEPAQGVHLLLRRRRPRRAPLRQLEDRLHGAADAGDAGRLGRAVHAAAACPSSTTCAPTRSSGPTHVEHVLGLVRRRRPT